MEHLKDLGIPVNPNRTISQMVALGEEEIHALFEPEDNEFVGFGKYGDKTYLEVWNEHPSYASWVLTTNQESDSPHWRLRRFARWLQQQKHQKAFMEVTASQHRIKTSSKADSSVGSFTVVDPKGYIPEKEHPDQTQMVQELAELEQMRQTLQNKIQAVAEQEAALQGGEGHAESHGGQAQEPEGDVRDGGCISEAPLSEESALTMAKIWHLQRNPSVSQSWQTLVWSHTTFVGRVGMLSKQHFVYGG